MPALPGVRWRWELCLVGPEADETSAPPGSLAIAAFFGYAPLPQHDPRARCCQMSSNLFTSALDS